MFFEGTPVLLVIVPLPSNRQIALHEVTSLFSESSVKKLHPLFFIICPETLEIIWITNEVIVPQYFVILVMFIQDNRQASLYPKITRFGQNHFFNLVI